MHGKRELDIYFELEPIISQRSRLIMRNLSQGKVAFALSALIFASMAYSTVFAASLTVNSTATAGGTTYNTVEAAVAAASAGDVITITDSATYYGRVTVQTPNLTIQAAAGQTPTIGGTSGGNLDAGFDIQQSSAGTLTLSGLIVSSGWPCEVRTGGGNLTIKNCIFETLNIAACLDVDGNSNLTVDQSLIVQNQTAEIVYLGGGTFTFTRSTFATSVTAGMRGMDIQNAASGTITDSIIVATNSAYPDWLYVGNTSTTVSNSDVFSTPGYYQHYTAGTSGNLSVDPALTNTSDPLSYTSFALPSGSALDTASSTGGKIGWEAGRATVPVALSGFGLE
jgi:hypothetical protein